MKRIFAIFLFSLSAIGADTPVAIVKGTNVLGTAIVDTQRFVPPAGTSNVVIAASEVSVIGPGWRYNPATGEFTQPDGKPIANGMKVRIDRAKLIDSAITELNSMQVSGANAAANWASLSAAQKDAAQKQTIQAVIRCSQTIELLLREQRSLLELKETTQ